jgi:hypothetical protein
MRQFEESDLRIAEYLACALDYLRLPIFKYTLQHDGRRDAELRDRGSSKLRDKCNVPGLPRDEAMYYSISTNEGFLVGR